MADGPRVAGVLGAYLVLYPRAKVWSLVPFLFFIPLRVPAWFVLGLWFVRQWVYSAGYVSAGAGFCRVFGAGIRIRHRRCDRLDPAGERWPAGARPREPRTIAAPARPIQGRGGFRAVNSAQNPPPSQRQVGQVIL